MFSSLIYVVACVGTSFFFKAEYCSIVHIYHILFIHLSINEHSSSFRLLIVNNATTNMYTNICSYPYLELLDHMVVLFLVFEELPYCFP